MLVANAYRKQCVDTQELSVYERKLSLEHFYLEVVTYQLNV